MPYREKYITLERYRGEYKGQGDMYVGFVIGYGYCDTSAFAIQPAHMNGYSPSCGRLYGNDSHYVMGRQQVEDTSLEAVKLSLRGLFVNGEAVIIVKSGMTLGKIAELFDVTVTELAKWNNIENPNKIQVGRQIKIYKDNIPTGITPSPDEIKELSEDITCGKCLDSTTVGEKSVPSNLNTNDASVLDGIVISSGLVGTLVQKSNTSFYINSMSELVRFKGSAPSSAIKISNIGKGIGSGAFIASSAIDIYKILSDQITRERFALNTSLNGISYSNPTFGVPYALTEVFYPGGFVKAISDRADLEAERREAMGNMYLPLSPKSYF